MDHHFAWLNFQEMTAWAQIYHDQIFSSSIHFVSCLNTGLGGCYDFVPWSSSWRHFPILMLRSKWWVYNSTYQWSPDFQLPMISAANRCRIFDTSFKVSCKFAMLRESMHNSDKWMLPSRHLDTLVTIFLYCIPESYHIWIIYWRNALEVAQKTSIAWSSNKLVSAFKDTRMTHVQDFWEK